jgi:hypothetical protein
VSPAAVARTAPYKTTYETAVTYRTAVTSKTAKNPTAHVNRLPARGDAQ